MMDFLQFMQIISRFSPKGLVKITFHLKYPKYLTSSHKEVKDLSFLRYAYKDNILPKRTCKSNFSLQIPQIVN